MQSMTRIGFPSKQHFPQRAELVFLTNQAHAHVTQSIFHYTNGYLMHTCLARAEPL